MTAPTPIAVTQMGRSYVAKPAATAGDAVNGNSVVNDGETYLELINTSGSTPHTCTVAVAQNGPDGNAVSGRLITLPANGATCSGKWPISIYGTTLQLTVDNAAITINPFRLG